MGKEETTEVKKENKPNFVLEPVYSQAGLVIKDVENDKQLSTEEALVLLLNEQRSMKRLLG